MSAALTGRRSRLVLRLDRLNVSLKFDRRALIVLAATGVIAVVAVVVTVLVGAHVPAGKAWSALMNEADYTSNVIVRDIRLPQALVALFVGAALGMSGAIFQHLSANPLVSPDVLGINQGAVVVMVVGVVVFNSTAPGAVFCLGGALLAAMAVYGLSVGSGLPRMRIVLVGVGVQSGLAALTTFLVTRAQQDQLEMLTRYLIGDLAHSAWPTVRALVPWVLILLLAGTALASKLQVLQLGDDLATGLGTDVVAVRTALLGVGVGLAAVTVASVGPVGFVAFIAPQLARGLARTSSASVLPIAAAVGGALVVVADYAGQYVLYPIHLPVGILTILLGGPYFLYLLLRMSRAGLA